VKRLIRSAAVIGIALVLALALSRLRPQPALAVYGRIPAMHLVDQSGAAFTGESMLGHVTVVDFIFTRCAASCPRLTARMAELQSRLERQRSGAHLLSISVDPEVDTPAVLRDYGRRARADFARWSFLTGPADDVANVVVRGFKVSAAKVAKGASDYEVMHGDWFILVDREGRVRGYYATDEPDAMDRIAADAVRLETDKR
jgi:protein SCO1/2